MVSKDRWTEAQSYERSYWQKSAQRIEQGSGDDLSWYKWKAEWLNERLEKAFPDAPFTLTDKSVLEVGSGPVGVISYIDAKERFALDPLCDFYGTEKALSENRSPDVKYLNSQGETLQFDDQTFDMGILDNVIDHVLNADTVMEEMNRVIKDKSVLFFTVNVHPLIGFFIHRVFSKLKIDRGHPHTFTEAKVARFLDKHGFTIVYKQADSFWKCMLNDLKSPSMKDKAKAILGLSEYLFTCVAVKR